MPTYLLDTNVLGDLANKKPEPTDLIGWIERNLSDCFISALTLHELEFGSVRLSLNRSLEDKLRSVKYFQLNAELIGLFSGRVMPVRDRDLVRAAWLRARAERLHRDIGLCDAIIAATAEQMGAFVVTRNVDDLRATGVPIIDSSNLQILMGPTLSDLLEPGIFRRSRQSI